MGNYEQLKQSVSNVIKTNGTQAITGQVLQNILLAMINSLGGNYQFVGIATPSTKPGTPDQNVFYIAGEGIYNNFSNIKVNMGELAVLKWNGTWSKQTVKVGFPPNELNISTIFPTMGDSGSNKYTLETAILQVPTEYRTNIGLNITFINKDTLKPETWVYNGNTFTNVLNWEKSNDSEGLRNLQNETNLLKGIVITSDKKYSDINVDISSTAGAETWYSNRAYPNTTSVTGIKINARTNGTLELGILNKIEKTREIVDSVEVKKGLGEYNFKATHSIDIDKECFFIQNASGNYVLYRVNSDENFPVISSSNKIDSITFKGDVLVQLISYSNLQDDLLKTQIEVEKVKEQTDKIPTIENSIKEIEANIKIGIIENGKCGNFDLATKTILEGTNRFYKKIALGNTKKIVVDFTGSEYYKVIVFKKDDAFAFYISCELDTTLNIEPIIKLTGANNAYIISNYEVTEDKIKLDGNIIEPSVNDVLSGNLWYEEYVVCRGKAKINSILGIQMTSSYGDVALIAVNRNSTIYHNKYMDWILYNSNGDFVSNGSGTSSVNIETEDADFMLIQKPTTTPIIVSYNQELIQYKEDIPYYTNKILSQVLEPTIYKSLSNSALIEVLKNYVYDKYVGKSVFFVGDSYAQGVDAKEYGGYPNDFAYRHPLADTQLGGAYIWSGRTISTFTSDNILKSVLKICTENGYMKTPLNYPLTDTSDLQYTRSILFEDVTEIDRIIGRKKASTVIIYSVNKSTFVKTELSRVFMQADVTEHTFRTKIKAKEGECIGLDFSANFAYKVDDNTFKAIDGSVINGSPLVQVCCNRCDYLIFEGGLNDMYNRGDNPETQVPFGTLLDADDYTTDTFDDKTFCGALEHMVREAAFKLKATKLGFLIMPQPGDDIWNNQYAKAIKDVCNKYGVPYLDMGNLKRMKIASFGSEVSRDFWCINTNGAFNLHPSAIGYYALMNDTINSFIDSL